MSQEQILELLKSNPKIKFSAQDIIHSIKGGIKKEIFYANIKKLERMDCIKKTERCWFYVIERKNRADNNIFKDNKK